MKRLLGTSCVMLAVALLISLTNFGVADDKDKDNDLVVTCEWGGITAFINTTGELVKKELTGNKGWWNFLLPVDVDNDGDVDFIAGNLGLNSRLHAAASARTAKWGGLPAQGRDSTAKQPRKVLSRYSHSERSSTTRTRSSAAPNTKSRKAGLCCKVPRPHRRIK